MGDGSGASWGFEGNEGVVIERPFFLRSRKEGVEWLGSGGLDKPCATDGCNGVADASWFVSVDFFSFCDENSYALTDSGAFVPDACDVCCIESMSIAGEWLFFIVVCWCVGLYTRSPELSTHMELMDVAKNESKSWPMLIAWQSPAKKLTSVAFPNIIVPTKGSLKSEAWRLLGFLVNYNETLPMENYSTFWTARVDYLKKISTQKSSSLYATNAKIRQNLR